MSDSEKVFILFGYRPGRGWMNIGLYHSKYSMIRYAKNHKHIFSQFAYNVCNTYLDDPVDWVPCNIICDSDCFFLFL